MAAPQTQTQEKRGKTKNKQINKNKVEKQVSPLNYSRGLNGQGPWKSGDAAQRERYLPPAAWRTMTDGCPPAGLLAGGWGLPLLPGNLALLKTESEAQLPALHQTSVFGGNWTFSKTTGPCLGCPVWLTLAEADPRTFPGAIWAFLGCCIHFVICFIKQS